MTLRTFTSESVTEGHPDKICDQISDTILDAMLEQDPEARVALETLVTTGLVHIAGEVTTSSYVEIPQLVRQKILDIGYTSSDIGFDGNSCGVSVSIGAQSPDIAGGVDDALESRAGEQDEVSKLGAGDQGIMFGYATNETDTLMPAPILLSHRIAENLSRVRRELDNGILRPDGKTQVSIDYDGHIPVAINTVVLSTQHHPDVTQDDLANLVLEKVISPVLAESKLDTSNVRYIINPSGRFVIGGPQGDAGLTGRKIIVDTYGGMARHGGGAFSGKDPSKVDRSAAYAMRWVAKNVVAAGLADKVELQVAYAIGVAKPVAVFVECFGTEKVEVESIQKAVMETFDLRPAAIIRDLDLKRPIFSKTSAYGHFGRELPEFNWEKTDRAGALREAAGR
ncbi:MAG: methionine adenosyltransferase [Actinobacteria bacterium]|nr:methionine adenosyltransferase [Actinomycetota bacterium]NCV37131.1 methionine adenosyltransferase [Actinomycetota bacterium]NCV81032.1 methionine adenosyltransferase [Actinomycetota bacterium]NCV98493.1 methionine adenosyltransferase [Actinomycetota bacterium]NCW23033.1 methionine adenosyltransferase [Actinomycetota bacterium]